MKLILGTFTGYVMTMKVCEFVEPNNPNNNNHVEYLVQDFNLKRKEVFTIVHCRSIFSNGGNVKRNTVFSIFSDKSDCEMIGENKKVLC